MRNRNRRWIYFWILISAYHSVIICEIVEATDATKRHQDNSSAKQSRSIFHPRMDYEQWKPLGRGDPLKNDPTYDYVPPVLDRVHYWIEPGQRKPDPHVPTEHQKTEVLLLGITSKKPSIGPSAVADSRRDTYDPFLKFVDGPKFHSHQKIPRPHYTSSSSYYSPAFYSTKNRLSDRNVYAKGTEQRVPSTMLIPPPVLLDKQVNIQPSIQLNSNSVPLTLQQQKSTTIKSTPQTTSTTKSSTLSASTTTIYPPDVTVQSANLIYHSSSYSDGSEWKNKNNFATASNFNSIPTSATFSANKIRQDEVLYQKHLRPESYIQIEFSNNQNDQNSSYKPLLADGSSHTVNYVTPPALGHHQTQEVMHKGQVTDDNLDEANTYVKIGKTEAQVHGTGIDLSNMPLSPNKIVMRHPSMMIQRPMMVFSHVKHPLMQNEVIQMPPLTLQTVQSMQTMQPPPITRTPSFTRPSNPILSVLEDEKSATEPVTDPTTLYVTTTTTTEPSTDVTTTQTPVTTTTTSLTTDPLFKHYKQPEEPIRGPLYLIIQGHSRVKTYGPTKHIHGIPVQDTNDIDERDERNDRSMYEVRHLHGFRKEKLAGEEKSRKGRSGDLQTLKHVVQTGLGAIDFSDVPVEKRVDDELKDDLKETELEVGYEVAEGKDITSEKYHKGIVEEARKLKDFESATEEH